MPGEVCRQRPNPARQQTSAHQSGFRNKPNLPHLLLEAGIAQQRPVWSDLPQSSALWIWDLPAAVDLCPHAEKEPMGQGWIGEAAGGRWEQETGRSRARILGSDGQ